MLSRSRWFGYGRGPAWFWWIVPHRLLTVSAVDACVRCRRKPRAGNWWLWGTRHGQGRGLPVFSRAQGPVADDTGESANRPHSRSRVRRTASCGPGRGLWPAVPRREVSTEEGDAQWDTYVT